MTTAPLLATGFGFVAILSWALLALFTAYAGPIPPFQLTALSFTLAATASALVLLIKGWRWSIFRQPGRVWLLGVGGLFGYHLFYFIALQNAPTVEASLIAYLWPLLIVLFSALLPGEHLRWYHVAGAALGFLGAGLLVTNGQGFKLQTDYAFGYAMAGVCALTWSSYSVLSRRFAHVPSDIVVGFCASVAVLAWGCHLAFEDWVSPQGFTQIAAIVGLGLGPVGLAFFAWDLGVKHGHIQVLGAASYAAPLLSTLVLVAAGQAQASWSLAVAVALITVGAVLAAKQLFVAKAKC